VTSLQVYLLDADTFIAAARRYYAFDLVPSFWNHLIRLASDGRIASIDRIKKQLAEGNDRLAEWIKNGNMKDAFFSTDQADVIAAYQEIMIWVQNNPQFMDAAKAKFAADEDGWLVAYAKAKNCIVVTNEVFHPDARKRVPIPNICRQFGIISVDTFQMLRALGVTIG
jgi:hypothetical protein